MKIQDIMTRNISTVTPDSTVNDAAKIMKKMNIGSVPVCDDQGRPVGIITDRDIAIRNVAKGDDINIPVKNIMTEDIIYGSPEMSVDEAAKKMADNQIRRLPIVDNGKITGIISLGDIAINAKAEAEVGETIASISVPSKPQK